ncbi:MAG: glucose-1-phosphate adenylyltransferase [Acidobacteria bacterium]|nr:glucose-1-phosphate adenylyltransferase [Acidobacteriota bacterium]
MARERKVLAMVLGGGQGTRLYPLTALRSKPAVPLAGKYRLIDIPLSNCINSNISKIFVLTQFNSASLNRHISRTYRFSAFSDGYVDVIAAEQTLDNRNWFQGTADAVRQAWRHLEAESADTLLVLAGDHLYQMDYRLFLQDHWTAGADITISTLAITEENASQFGLLKIDRYGRVVEFREKPVGEELLAMRVDTSSVGLSPEKATKRTFLASMGIYVFNLNVLRELLKEEAHVDFGRQLIPAAIATRHVRAFLYDGYWEDIGTIGAFYNANIDLTRAIPKFNLYDPEAPIYTAPRNLPAAKIKDCIIQDSLISEGSILNGAELHNSVIGIRSRLQHGVNLDSVIVMGADYYETIEEMCEDQVAGRPLIGIGEGSIIRKAIIDKNARIGANVQILNENRVDDLDGENFYIRDKVVIIPKDVTIPDGTVI